MRVPATLERRDIRKNHELVARVVNGRISFGDGTNRDNIDGEWITVVTPIGANSDFTVDHNLQRIPVGYLVMQTDKACDIYTGSVPATETQITLRVDSSRVTLVLFII